jgi:hypothetical protein
VIDAAAAAEMPASPPGRASSIWRIVAIVAAFHVAIGLIGFVFFSTMGLGSTGVGSCGGG